MVSGGWLHSAGVVTAGEGADGRSGWSAQEPVVHELLLSEVNATGVFHSAAALPTEVIEVDACDSMPAAQRSVVHEALLVETEPTPVDPIPAHEPVVHEALLVETEPTADPTPAHEPAAHEALPTAIDPPLEF